MKNANVTETELPSILHTIEIDEEQLQSAAEANLGRTLTSQELKRISCAFADSDEAFSAVYEAIIEAARDAMDNTDGRWDRHDNEVSGSPSARD